MDWTTIVWIAYLHIAGAFLFFHFMESMNEERIKPLLEVPRLLRIIVLCAWPYFMIWWFLPNFPLTKEKQ